MITYYNVPNHAYMDTRIYFAKTYDQYTPEQITQLYNLCKSQFDRDWLIDRLYVYRPGRRRSRKKDPYYILTARQLLEEQHDTTTTYYGSTIPE